MKIAVFSDTHFLDPFRGIALLQRLIDHYAADAKMILHAGDLVHPDILLAFEGRILHAVQGNLDPPRPEVPVRKIVAVAGWRIGLVHGWGRGLQVEKNAAEAFAGERIDALVYGHSHLPVCHRRGGILRFNPGSCTERRSAPYHSFGLLEIDQTIKGSIINVDALVQEGIF